MKNTKDINRGESFAALPGSANLGQGWRVAFMRWVMAHELIGTAAFIVVTMVMIPPTIIWMILDFLWLDALRQVDREGDSPNDGDMR